jgi:hypothetical protein
MTPQLRGRWVKIPRGQEAVEERWRLARPGRCTPIRGPVITERLIPSHHIVLETLDLRYSPALGTVCISGDKS